MLTRLVRDLSPRIWIAIRAYASDDEHANDLLQDCWVHILEQLDRYVRHDSFPRWAVAVSRNYCRSILRADRSVRRVEMALGHAGQLSEVSDESRSPVEEVARQQYWKRVVHEALGHLPDRERDVVVLRILEGRDTADTADILGISEAGVRSILLRAMTRLRRMKGLREVLPEWMGAR